MAAEAYRKILRALGGSVRVRITSAAVAVVAAALLLGAVALVAGLHAALIREARAALTLRAAEVARVAQEGGDPIASVSGAEDHMLQVVRPDGAVVSATGNLTGRPAVVSLPPGESRVVEVPFDDDPFVVVAVSAGDQTVLLGQSLEAAQTSTRTVETFLAIGLPALLALVGVTAWRAVGRALAPVDALRAEVDAISGAHLQRRVSAPGLRDEIGRLASTMNRMLDRVEEAQTRQRRFVADASHELRSPIAAIRQHAEVALAHPDHAGTLPAIAHAESLRMQALVDDLLLLAQADEARLQLRRTPVDLDDVVMAEAVRLRASGRLQVDTTQVSAVRVDGDAMALRRMVANLADNAQRHARATVALSVFERNGWAVLMVDDDGPGVPGPQRSRVFERFVRLDDARARAEGGSGLGLAIVAEIVRAHAGTVAIDDAPLGGARIVVRLPVPT